MSGSQSVTSLNVRRAASLRRVTMSSVTGWQNWQAKPSPPHTFATTPSYTQVAPWRGQRLRLPELAEKRPYRSATSGGHGAEGQPTDPWPLAEWDGQCSRHECSEHWCQVTYDKRPREVPTGGGKGEEVDVTGVMPPAALALLPLCCLVPYFPWRNLLSSSFFFENPKG